MTATTILLGSSQPRAFQERLAALLPEMRCLASQPWDLAAAWLLVEEAGGVITTWEGAPITLAAPGVVAANPTLHPQVLALLAEVASGE